MAEHVQVNYQVVLSEETLEKICKYKEDLANNKAEPGKYLKARIVDSNLNSISICMFIEMLLSTKKPMIFAEQEVRCDGTDWNSVEFSILGDINVVMRAQAFDNGVWYSNLCTRHNNPLDIELMFTPGIMLNNGTTKHNNPDYLAVVENNSINQEKYNTLIKQRILPLLAHANFKAKNEKKALVVLPGIGCGNFAGNFIGQLEPKLAKAIQGIIEAYKFENIKGIQLGFHESDICMKPKVINNVMYEVKGNGLPQLSSPDIFGKIFKDCKLYKIVAWDHVSLPGNDFFSHNMRNTDDGVAAAATNSMELITGTQGTYEKGKYLPPKGYRDWEQLAKSKNIRLIANKSNIKVVSGEGHYYDIPEKYSNHINQ